MNIEIANRLVGLRKENNLSQEALAEKLGISRQAVSKWERAEASPDTDNLILLARLYGVSLDELLKTEDEIPRPEAEETAGTQGWEEASDGSPLKGADRPADGAYQKENRTAGDSGQAEEDGCGGEEDWGGHTWQRGGESVHIGKDGIHVQNQDKGEEVHVSWKGIHVKDPKRGEEVHVGWDGVHVHSQRDGEIDVDAGGVRRNGEKWEDYPGHCVFWKEPEFPYSILIIVAYLVLGAIWGLWGYGLLLFLTIPLWHSVRSAWRHRDPGRFAFPVLAFGVWLALGLSCHLWHPGWLVFLLIPVYYALVHYVREKRRKKKEAREQKMAGEQEETREQEEV